MSGFTEQAFGPDPKGSGPETEKKANCHDTDPWPVLGTEACYGLAGEVVNTISPQAAAATESLVTFSKVPEALTEPLDTMAESALALCSGDPEELTGVIGYSLQVLVDLDRPVHDLTGTKLVDGWQPDALPEKIATMTGHREGRLVAGEVQLSSATLDRENPRPS